MPLQNNPILRKPCLWQGMGLQIYDVLTNLRFVTHAKGKGMLAKQVRASISNICYHAKQVGVTCILTNRRFVCKHIYAMQDLYGKYQVRHVKVVCKHICANMPLQIVDVLTIQRIVCLLCT